MHITHVGVKDVFKIFTGWKITSINGKNFSLFGVIDNDTIEATQV